MGWSEKGNPTRKITREKNTDLLLGQLVGEVSNHDLGLGWNAVGGRATLPTLLLSTVLVLALLVGVLLVGDIRQRLVLSSSGLALGSLTLLARSPILR